MDERPSYKELEQIIERVELEAVKDKQEQKRQFEHSRLIKILDAIPDGVYLVSQQHDIEYVNPVLKKEFGSIKDRKCYEYFHGRTQGCVWCKRAEIFAGKSVQWLWYFAKTNRHYDMFETPIENADGSISKLAILHDITKLIQAEEALKKSESSLIERTNELENMNAALKVLLEKRNEDAVNIEQKIFSNYKRLILPIIERIKNNQTEKGRQDLMDILEAELKNIISPFSKKLSDPMINLTPKEIEIAGFIKFGKSNKEISEILNNSIHTISHHRENIRKKTGLKNKKINLRTFLSTL